MPLNLLLQEAECKKEMLDVKFMADTKVADSKRAFEMQKAAFSQEINVKVRGICRMGRGLLWGFSSGSCGMSVVMQHVWVTLMLLLSIIIVFCEEWE